MGICVDACLCALWTPPNSLIVGQCEHTSMKHHKAARKEYRQTSRTNKYWNIKPQIKCVTTEVSHYGNRCGDNF